jgi:hypothetical protein
MVVSWLWSLGVRKNQEGTWKILLQSMFGMLDHALALEALHYSIDTSNQDTHQKARHQWYVLPTCETALEHTTISCPLLYLPSSLSRPLDI